MKPNQFIAVVCLLLALVLLAIDQVSVPTPRPTVLRAIIVEESADRTPDLAVVLASMEVRGLFEEFRLIDPDTPSDLQQYVDRTTSLPTLFIVDPDNKIWYEGEVPLTVQAWRSLVAEIKGDK